MVFKLIFSILLLPYLVSSSQSECQDSFTSLLLHDPSKLSKMIYYSGRDLNDFGDQYACEQLENTRFISIILTTDQAIVGIGVCGLSQCHAKDYENRLDWATNLVISKYPAASHIISADSFTVIDVKAHDNRNFDSAAYLSLIFICVLLSIVTLGTILGKRHTGEEVRGWRAVFMCFDLSGNLSKIFTFPSSTENFHVFNGLRVISMLFICYSHNYVNTFPAPAKNPTRPVTMLQEFWTHLDIFPIYMVDVFFIISAFLLTFFLFPQIQKNKGKMNWGMFVVHRLLRICPIYFFLFMIYLNLYDYLGSGPIWPTYNLKIENSCNYWWANLLFISNFIPSDDYSCMPWSWFISNDMQFHLFTPILLIIHCKNKLIGYCLVAFLALASFVFTFVQSYVNEYNPGILYGTSNKEQYLNNYEKPYVRIGPYLIAVFFALVYREYRNHAEKERPKEMELSNVQEYQLLNSEKSKMFRFEKGLVAWVDDWRYRVVAYCVGWGVMLSVPFMTYNFDRNGTDYWSRGSKALFIAAEHQLFALGFIVWLLPLVEGHGGGFKYVLSSKYMAIFAKISFSFYLVHPMVILFSVYNRPDSQYISHFGMIYRYPSIVFYSTIFAFLGTACIESPILALEKILFRTRKH